MVRKYMIESAEYGDAIISAEDMNTALEIWTEERNLPIYTNPDSIDIMETSESND